MNTSVEGIIVNNCQYAPIYLIQDPGATQVLTLSLLLYLHLFEIIFNNIDDHICRQILTS